MNVSKDFGSDSKSLILRLFVCMSLLTLFFTTILSIVTPAATAANQPISTAQVEAFANGTVSYAYDAPANSAQTTHRSEVFEASADPSISSEFADRSWPRLADLIWPHP